MNETARLQKNHQAPAEAPSENEGPSEPPIMLTADKGRKLVFDNFYFKQRVHCMTEEHQNVDVYWVSHLSVENRVSGNHLSSEKPAADAVMQMENGLCLPEIPCLSFLKPVVCKHIPHQYSKEMAEKSKMVFITLSKKLLLCNSRKYPYSPHRRDWKFQGGGGGGLSKTPKFKATYGAEWELPWEGGGYGYSLELHIVKNIICNMTSLHNLYRFTHMFALGIFTSNTDMDCKSILIKAVFFL